MKPAVSGLLFILCLGPFLYSEDKGSADSFHIFAVNLSSSSTSLRLESEGKSLFQVPYLAAASVSRMITLRNPGKYQLFFHNSATNEDQSPQSDTGIPYLYVLSPGKNYLVRILSDTNADLYELSSNDTLISSSSKKQAAQICFINASRSVIPLIQVAKGWNNEVMVSITDLGIQEHSNFGSLNVPGQYGCFWNTQGMGKNTAAMVLSTAEGIPINMNFEESSFWAFIVYRESGSFKTVGRLVNVSP